MDGSESPRAMRRVIADEHGYNQVFALVGSTVERMRRRSEWMVKHIEASGAKRVLELGCGTGEAANFLAEHSSAEIVAVDISEAFLAQARERFKRPNLRYELLDLLGPAPKALGVFDMVCGNGILHHLVKVLPELMASLRHITTPDGRLAFIEPNFLNPYCAFSFGTPVGRRLAKLEPDEMAFTRRQLKTVLTGAGWKNIDVATRDFLVPGVPESLVKPIIAVEPILEATPLTRWLAQSHFITAEA